MVELKIQLFISLNAITEMRGSRCLIHESVIPGEQVCSKRVEVGNAKTTMMKKIVMPERRPG